ncbi:hypothetical protein SO694_00118096 [Aureococcus anophagefferens]|uniref:VOC domain-containing protein n=1 Tax=Aureococcus anophagefferens TaxID=44056 RepID=A0ABR1FW39_AURAN
MVVLLLQLLLLQRVAAMRAPRAPSLATNRRAALRGAAAVLATATLPAIAAPPPVPGAFDYFSQCASVPRALVINSVDVDATVAFFSKALGMDAVSRSPDGSARVSFGPTQLSRPADFVPGISSFEVDGARPRGLAFGGEVVDAYGVWNVLARAAFPCGSSSATSAPRPRHGARARARPPTADESPALRPNPPGAAYLESCADAVGVLLIPEKKKRKAADAPAAGPTPSARSASGCGEPKRGRAFSVFALMLGATAVAAVVRSTTVLSAVSTGAELAVNGRGLYHCKNGYPDVPKAYDRDWGDLTGDWYVVMQNPADQARAS